MHAGRGLSRRPFCAADAPSGPSGIIPVLPAQPLAVPPAEESTAEHSAGVKVVAHSQGTAAAPSHWLVAARTYGTVLQAAAVPGAQPIPGATPHVVSIRIEAGELSSLTGIFKNLYRRLSPGDGVVIDAPGIDAPGIDAPGSTASAQPGISREQLARALFEGGFDCPLICAGRKVLRAEVVAGLVGRLLGGGALGAGPRCFPGVAVPLVPEADRIVVMARRSELAPPDERTLRLSVIMPVYNERSTVREVLDRLLDKTIPGIEIEICVVESNSTDGTRDEVLRYADHPRVRLICENKPSGKGHAVRAGLAVATGDFVLIQDADLEYDLDDYEKLLAPLRDGTAGFVLGSRHRAGEKAWKVRQFSDQQAAAHLMNIGHLVFAWMLNVTFGQKMRDPFTMFKVFRRDAIHNVAFECNGFDFDLELVGKLIRLGYRPLEIDISYNSRSFKEGKKVSALRDPPTWVRACVKHRFSRLHLWPEARRC